MNKSRGEFYVMQMDYRDQINPFAQKQLARERELKSIQRHGEMVRRRFRRDNLRILQRLYEELNLALNGANVVGLYFLFTPGYSVWLSLAAVASMVGTVLLYLQNKRLRRKLFAVFMK